MMEDEMTRDKMDKDGTNWFFSAEGTVLRQPRVERREGTDRRATLGNGINPRRRSPNGTALTAPPLTPENARS